MNTDSEETVRDDPLKMSTIGIGAGLMLGLLGSVPILYANITPVTISSLIRDAGFSPEEAGFVFTINMLGTAFGGFGIIFFVERLEWRWAAGFLLSALIVIEVASSFMHTPAPLYGIRLLHGLVGGALSGIILSVVSRTHKPERIMAFNLMFLLLLGGVLTMVLTPMIANQGTAIIWWSLAGYYVIGLLLLPLIRVSESAQKTERGYSLKQADALYILLAMAALFFYQNGNMAIYAYVIQLGSSYKLDGSLVGTVVAISLWIGGPGALLVAWWSIRKGRLRPMFITTCAMAVSVLVLLSPTQAGYIVGTIGFGIAFSMSYPYVIGITLELDNTGKLGAVAGLISTLGLASGPTVASLLVVDDTYSRTLLFGSAALFASAFLALPTARMLDLMNPTERVHW